MVHRSLQRKSRRLRYSFINLLSRGIVAKMITKIRESGKRAEFTRKQGDHKKTRK
jgi:hypothetical protein